METITRVTILEVDGDKLPATWSAERDLYVSKRYFASRVMLEFEDRSYTVWARELKDAVDIAVGDKGWNMNEELNCWAWIVLGVLSGLLAAGTFYALFAR